MAEASDNDQGSSDMKLSTRRRRKKSIVWEHFTVERVDSECARACCKRCKQTFAYSSGSKCLGTSHLKRHLASGSCPRNQLQDRRQLTPYTPPMKGGGSGTDRLKKRFKGSSGSWGNLYDMDHTRLDIAKMIIMHEYPLHMVEQSAFVTFVQNLQPHFNMVTFSTVEGDCLVIFQKEKQNLKQLLKAILGRVSLTLDLWTSSRTLGYMSLTGQFIDNDWKLHRRILNFTTVSSHSGSALTEAIWTCLLDWNLENKLFTVSLDDCSLHDSIGANLKEHLSNKNALMLNGGLFVSSCFARILNLIAQDGLKAIHETVYEVRESIKYVKASQLHEEKFAQVVQQLQIASTKSLSLDVCTQWNTTYLMLLAALDYKEAFSYLQTSDPDYNRAPSEEGWKKVENLCKYLKVLYNAANVFTGITHPTANIYFHEVWKIKLELMHAAGSEDAIVSSLTKQMHERFDKYWKDCSLALAVIVVMDPRFKMKLVEFSYSKIYGEDAYTFIKIVSDGIRDLYLEYAADPQPLTPVYLENGPANNTVEGTVGTPLPNDDGLQDFDVFISETTNGRRTQTELDQYLEEALIPRIQDFDILDWWKLNKLKYPNLSKMARDVLAIPISTVTSDFIFGSGRKVLDDYRSSLQPETLEALVCAKDWLQQQNVPVEGPSNALVKMEF
ncbi:zinc finger BED domain-containing protein RICESLEEPER 2-like [Magnolia sinica]|uniref:zinc finger BED domain-containing protein RICESLEEPER 2-like n=1 Tax=Magnolia sinica TaxID=86752 RepID=UPI002659431E|nr:zinc finger BED domain-containing protein RICESLEEPER 2-like [Magnolia sinica]XP_058115570.1 zinc finger BED domain-containing protein RICESLEEPER 2-like [Magnolia sinica]XP_058115571.1 zinc finger BED domain-containing protein RICESLEEPER 2-like [Magnolia sinica]